MQRSISFSLLKKCIYTVLRDLIVGLLLFCRFSSNLDFLDHCIFCKTLSWKNLLVKLNSATFDVPWSSQGHFTHGQDTRDPLAETLTLILSPPFSISKKIHFVPYHWNDSFYSKNILLK